MCSLLHMHQQIDKMHLIKYILASYLSHIQFPMHLSILKIRSICRTYVIYCYLFSLYDFFPKWWTYSIALGHLRISLWWMKKNKAQQNCSTTSSQFVMLLELFLPVSELDNKGSARQQAGLSDVMEIKGSQPFMVHLALCGDVYVDW